MPPRPRAPPCTRPRPQRGGALLGGARLRAHARAEERSPVESWAGRHATTQRNASSWRCLHARRAILSSWCLCVSRCGAGKSPPPFPPTHPPTVPTMGNSGAHKAWQRTRSGGCGGGLQCRTGWEGAAVWSADCQGAAPQGFCVAQDGGSRSTPGNSSAGKIVSSCGESRIFRRGGRKRRSCVLRRQLLPCQRTSS